MRLRWRWGVLLVSVAALCSAPAVVAAVPTASSDESATALLSAIQASAATRYSGYAEASGTLSLPVTSQFNSVADLFGGTTDMRVWWMSPSQWRVDTITDTGESDVHSIGDDLWTWDYQSHHASLQLNVEPAAVRLPVAADLLPTTLARRLLSEATPAEVSRLPDERVAGHVVPGLLLRPAAPASTIDRVEIWADPHSGVALRVVVFSGGRTVLSTEFLDFSAHAPAPSELAFTPPADALATMESRRDLIALIDQFGGSYPPSHLAGFERNSELTADGSIGVYGRGVTEFTAIPLPDGVADSLRAQLSKTLGATDVGPGITVSVGPVNAVLTNNVGGSVGPFQNGMSWLLTGTVSTALLDRAAAQLIGAAP